MKQAAQVAQCNCVEGYHAQTSTLCTKQDATVVDSDCENAAGNAYCTNAVLSGPRGCQGDALGDGPSAMVRDCKLACGKYCAVTTNSCMSKMPGQGSFDNAQRYCTKPTQLQSCLDTSIVDYACPHHAFGEDVPSTCSDYTCATTFTAFWNRCQSVVQGLQSSNAKVYADFVAFAKKCAGPLC